MIALFCLLAAAPFRGWADCTVGKPAPQGVVRLSRPRISLPLRLTGNTQVSTVFVTVNGLRVPATYTALSGRVSYLPPQPLPPGNYQVTSVVYTNDRQSVRENWAFAVPSGPLPDTLPDTSPAQTDAEQIITRFRAGLKLPPFRADPALHAAAQAHAAFLQTTGLFDHREDADRPGFSGREPSERVLAWGYPGDVDEDLGKGRTIAQILAGLFDAPYHRLPFLVPESPDFGAGFAGGVGVFNFGDNTGGTGDVVSPGDGQENVPVGWSGSEHPDPLRLHAGATRPAGYPLVWAHFAPVNSSVRVRSAGLRDADKNAVPCVVNTPQNDDELTNAVLIFSVKPLRPGTTYEAFVNAVDGDGRDVSRVWHFRTQGAAGKPPAKVEQSRTHGKRSR